MPEWLKVQYMKIATPFNVSLPAVMAGVAALSDSGYLEKSISMTVEGRKFLTENIPFKVYDSKANFILVDVSPQIAKDISESLMKKGIIVRDCRSFKNAGESLIRVTVGTKEQNEKVVSAFEEAKAGSN
jgi:histidinol-phosphate aminotransferase